MGIARINGGQNYIKSFEIPLKRSQISDAYNKETACDAFSHSSEITEQDNSITLILTGTSKHKTETEKALKEYGGQIRKELTSIGGMIIDLPRANLKSFANSVSSDITVKEEALTIPNLYRYPSSSHIISNPDAKDATKKNEIYFAETALNKLKNRGEINSLPSDSSSIKMHNAFIDSLGIDKLHEKGITGKGVGVCVIDSGIAEHPDLKDNISVWKDFTKDNSQTPIDKLGHGTLVTGLLAGNGTKSNGLIKGVAPDVDLIGARVKTVSEGILALQWAIENKDKHNIKVINISLGDFAIRSSSKDPWVQAAEKAVEAGITVVVAAGNEGPGESTISTPGTSQKVITVGSLDDRQTISKSDDKVAENSSRGPSIDGFAKPDVLAPGINLISTLAEGSIMDVKNQHNPYVAQSGSSLATPIVSGLCALMLQANPDLTNEQIKAIISKTATNVDGADLYSQGQGAINPEQAIELAINLHKNNTTENIA